MRTPAVEGGTPRGASKNEDRLHAWAAQGAADSRANLTDLAVGVQRIWHLLAVLSGAEGRAVRVDPALVQLQYRAELCLLPLTNCERFSWTDK